MRRGRLRAYEGRWTRTDRLVRLEGGGDGRLCVEVRVWMSDNGTLSFDLEISKNAVQRLFTFQDQHLKEIAIRAVEPARDAPLFIVVLLQQWVLAAAGPNAAGQTVILGLGSRFSDLFGLFRRRDSLGCIAVLFGRATLYGWTGCWSHYGLDFRSSDGCRGRDDCRGWF